MDAEILKRLDALAAKLNVGAAELWRVLVRQAQIDAWVNGAWCVGLLLVAIACGALTVMFAKSDDYDAETPTVFFGIATLAALLICGLVASSIPTYVFNPEYAALEKIIGAMK